MVAFDQAARRVVYVMRFADYGGLVVCARSPSFRALEQLDFAVSVLGETLEGNTGPITERIAAWGALFRAFAGSLVRWDLRDNDVAVPATLDGVLDQDHAFLLDIARAWYRRTVLSAPEPPAESAPEPDDTEDVLTGLPVFDRQPAMAAEAAE